MLRLRPYKKCDAERIVSWIKDERSFRQWCADRYESYPICAEDMNRHYDTLSYSDSFFAFTAFDESGAVGHLIMRFTDEERSVVRFGFIIIDSEKRGTGLGKEMLSLSLKYAFEILKASTVTLGVFENNPNALHCYTAAGFHEITPQKRSSYDILGEKWGCIEMQITGADHAAGK